MRLPADQPITYRQLHERVAAEVHSRYATQIPQCEGDCDRLLFQLERPPRDPLFNILDVRVRLFESVAGMSTELPTGANLTCILECTSRVQGDASAFALRSKSPSKRSITATHASASPWCRRIRRSARRSNNDSANRTLLRHCSWSTRGRGCFLCR